MNAPRDWVVPWPHGRTHPGAPLATTWLADLSSALAGHDPSALAAATGIRRSTVEAVIDGRRWPTLHTVMALAEYADADEGDR